MEPSNNTETEDETVALRRKKLRRVSFADNEITSVHIFRPDDSSSSDTPPGSVPSSSPSPSPEVVGFFQDLAGDSDEDDELDLKESSSPPNREAADLNHSFLRPLGSPSPSSSSAAPSTDDEDDFRGPVSSSFIRPERLPDSAASDDLTMDSTAFSLHYRSLARSDFEDLKTPSRFSPQFEETLPSQGSGRSASTTGCFMVLSEAKMQSPQSGVPTDPVNCCRDSSDMSMTGLDPQKYDYDRLSPTLDAILVEGSKDLPAISPLNPEAAESRLSSPVDQVIRDLLDNKGNHIGVDDSVQPHGTHDSEAADTPNVGPAMGRVGKHDTVPDDSLHQIKTPDTSIKETKKFVEDASAAIHKELDFLIANSARTPLMMGNSVQSKLGYGVAQVKGSNLEDRGQMSDINEKDCEYNQVETRNASLDEHLNGLTQGNRMNQGSIITDSHGIDSFRNLAMLTDNEQTVDSKTGEQDFSLISVDFQSGKNSRTGEITASCLQIDQTDSTVEKRKDDVASVTYDNPFSSPVMLLNQKRSQHVECQRTCSHELKQLKKHNESVNSGLGQDAESNSDAAADGFGLSGFENGVKTSTDCMISQSASKRKPAESPSNMVLFLSTPSKESTTLLPSLHGSSSELLNSNMQDLSNKDNSYGHCHLDNNCRGAPEVALSPVTKSGFEFSFEKKRKGIEIQLPGDGDNKDKFGRIIRSPEVHIGNSDIQLNSEQRRYMSSGKKLRDQTWNDWADFLKKFLGSTQHFLSPSVDKLNLRLICKLEEILVHLQKVKQCEFLCSDIHPQKKIADTQNVSRHKRYVEGRMLMLNISYEKAKLQLMRMKRDRLLKKVQQLNHGLQESKEMELRFMASLSKGVAVDTQANDIRITTSLLNSEGKCQVIELRQELENLTCKAKSLSEFFHSVCKIEGVQSYIDTIEYVRDYIQKRMCNKFIFQSFKQWVIEDFEHTDGCYKIILNYCGYVIQRFAVNASLPSIITSNELNDVNIMKTFPDINACSAFEFVLNTRTTKKCTDSISLGQETQITSSLLSNLLDVVEEVQLSRIEIRNLVQAKFFSHSGQQLDLQLVFMDFSSGRKVKVTFDMTCIKCGAYPAKVLPSQILGHTGMEHDSPLSLVSQVRIAAESVGVGYLRIIRLCRCISRIIQPCT
ncbi:uncharacterized protein LOC130972989 isoform X3 [Arachis stenosperma]|uniref:uncharacterized protein LOC130972989 isoform X3 n=1 Tax=Arachis stenosperma TaxID=217475 RepID=UPI0025AC8912|nr:uncharacterized protein LOC130972989 isoform X3 [Arachis stenosperma]